MSSSLEAAEWPAESDRADFLCQWQRESLHHSLGLRNRFWGKKWITGPRRRGPVPERSVGPHRVVLLPPLPDHDLGLLQRVEDLPVQAFLPQLSIETLAIPVLPWTTGFDV